MTSHQEHTSGAPENILIVGATRGLGASLANLYASQNKTTVYGTTRATDAGPRGKADGKLDDRIVWVPNIDVSERSVGTRLVNQLGKLGGGGGDLAGGVVAFDVVVSLRVPKKDSIAFHYGGDLTLWKWS